MRDFSKKKELAPGGSKFFTFIEVPILKGTQCLWMTAHFIKYPLNVRI